MWNTQQTRSAMRVHEFETAILAMGINPKEAKLENGHVKWFICEGKEMLGANIIVYDSKGKALVLPDFEWPEDDGAIYVEHYRDIYGKILGVTINGRPVYRDDRLDLKF